MKVGAFAPVRWIHQRRAQTSTQPQHRLDLMQANPPPASDQGCVPPPMAAAGIHRVCRRAAGARWRPCLVVRRQTDHDFIVNIPNRASVTRVGGQSLTNNLISGPHGHRPAKPKSYIRGGEAPRDGTHLRKRLLLGPRVTAVTHPAWNSGSHDRSAGEPPAHGGARAL